MYLSDTKVEMHCNLQNNVFYTMFILLLYLKKKNKHTFKECLFRSRQVCRIFPEKTEIDTLKIAMARKIVIYRLFYVVL